MTDIRVSVQWEKSTVFAGETIDCKIVFKNISQAPSNRRSPSPSSQLLSHASARERWKESLPAQSKSNDSFINSSPKLNTSRPNDRTHRSAASLSGASNFKPASVATIKQGSTHGTQLPIHSHRKSVSIISLAADAVKGNHVSNSQDEPLRRPGRGHARAASLQVLPRRNGDTAAGPFSASATDRATTLLSPFIRSSRSFAEQGSDAEHYMKTQRSLAAGSVTSRHFRNTSETLSNFRFPRVPASIHESSGQALSMGPSTASGEAMALLSPGSLGLANVQDQLNPLTRILSPASMNGTPRSSGEFYSMSNNSTETLASEYVTQDHTRLHSRAAQGRQVPHLTSMRNSKPPEALMMGYGQITGYYILDGSLIDQTPFEEVKKKGIIGGQGGGGVVRSDSTERDSGFFGALSWGNIGDSLGGLLGGNELSSIKETRSSDTAKSIPIISTPQAILFVNLLLRPGESRTYSYSHPLPKGIPPTHKGRAMKVSYSLTVGTQRAAKATQQHQVRHVSIPFRVLPGVNSFGEISSYDLMSPHIMLRNDASISAIHENEHSRANVAVGTTSGEYDSSTQGFLSYVENLLHQSRQNSSLGLLSPTGCGKKSFVPAEEEAATVKQAVDLAILHSNSTLSSKRNPNRFEITRSGCRVAAIMLARPAYRLGETITAVIDFQEAEVSCHFLNATLETSETIDSTIALRSKASVQRVTRRTIASQSELTLFAAKVVFSPIIPSSATPEFVTSGVSLEWKLRFEFITSQTRDDTGLDDGLHDLLEEIAEDDRGTVMAAVRGLPCETFDVTVPLRIYGATAGLGERIEIGEFPI